MVMTSGVPGRNLPPGDDELIRRIQELERAVRELRSANPLATAGLVPSPNALTVTGNLAVTGTLSLPAGIIGDAALANPVSFGRTGGAVTNFAVPTSATAINSQTIAVPAGYSRAIVFVVTNCTIYSLSTSTAGVYLKAAIGSVTMTNATSNALDPVNGFNWAPMGSSATATLTGLSGGNITVLGCMSSTNALPADTHNVLNLDAIAIFLR